MSTEDLQKDPEVSGSTRRLKGDVNAYVVVGVLIILAAIATWIVPSGVYDRVTKPGSDVKVVVPGTYHEVAATPVGPWNVFLLIQEGLVSAGTIIFFILAVGGCFGLISQSGAVTSLMARVVTHFHGKVYEKWSFIFIYAVLFSCSATFGFAEQGIVSFRSS